MKLYALTGTQKKILSFTWISLPFFLGFWAMYEENVVLRTGSHQPTSHQNVAVSIKGMVLYVSPHQATYYQGSEFIFAGFLISSAVFIIAYRHFIDP